MLPMSCLQMTPMRWRQTWMQHLCRHTGRPLQNLHQQVSTTVKLLATCWHLNLHCKSQESFLWPTAAWDCHFG